MTTVMNVVSPTVMQSLGWALLHFLWQGTAIAAVCAAAMALCGRAATRYLFGVGALVLMLLAPLATFFFYSQQHFIAPEISRSSARHALTGPTAKSKTAEKASAQRFPAPPSPDALPWLVGARRPGGALLN